MAFLAYIGFTNEEYHVACVDFIVPCGGTKGRRRGTLRSPSPPSSGLHLLTPEPRLRGSPLAAGTLPLTAMVCTNIVCAILVSCGRSLFRILCFDCIFRFSFVLMEDRRCFYWLYRSFLDYHAMYCVVIQNVRTALANAVFFASAQMKNKRHKPNIPTETRTIPARTQTAAHPIEVATSDRTGIAQTISL